MPRRPTSGKTALNVVFPVHLNARLFAELVLYAKARGLMPHKHQASPLLRAILLSLVEPEENWSFQTTIEAIEAIALEGFELQQFDTKLFIRGTAREELWQERHASHDAAATAPPADYFHLVSLQERGLSTAEQDARLATIEAVLRVEKETND